MACGSDCLQGTSAGLFVRPCLMAHNNYGRMIPVPCRNPFGMVLFKNMLTSTKLCQNGSERQAELVAIFEAIRLVEGHERAAEGSFADSRSAFSLSE